MTRSGCPRSRSKPWAGGCRWGGGGGVISIWIEVNEVIQRVCRVKKGLVTEPDSCISGCPSPITQDHHQGQTQSNEVKTIHQRNHGVSHQTQKSYYRIWESGGIRWNLNEAIFWWLKAKENSIKAPTSTAKWSQGPVSLETIKLKKMWYIMFRNTLSESLHLGCESCPFAS